MVETLLSLEEIVEKIRPEKPSTVLLSEFGSPHRSGFDSRLNATTEAPLFQRLQSR